ncbi:MAG: hypothetical protein KDE58_32125, partial [Caldilineaceae bacterium]|nr:hypothetical protein [Caldilineaceae bacterium]
GLRQQFIDHLDHGVPPHEIRRRVASMAEGKVKVHRPEAARRLVLRRWPMTIAAVYLPNQPTGAAERVKAWAASIREELRRG